MVVFNRRDSNAAVMVRKTPDEKVVDRMTRSKEDAKRWKEEEEEERGLGQIVADTVPTLLTFCSSAKDVRRSTRCLSLNPMAKRWG